MLSQRLKSIVQMAPEAHTVADIGCDHGKVAVWLVKNGKANSAICADLSARSLDKACRLAKANGLEKNIALREGSGFDVLVAGEAQVAVVAGMGGELIARLLDEGGAKVPDTLVLSCNKAPDVLRRKLCDLGFAIDDEQLVLENRIYYPVIRAKRGDAWQLDEMELEFGPVLLQNKPKLLKQYVWQRIRITEAIRSKLQNNKTPRTAQLRKEIEERLRAYMEVYTCL